MPLLLYIILLTVCCVQISCTCASPSLPQTPIRLRTASLFKCAVPVPCEDE